MKKTIVSSILGAAALTLFAVPNAQAASSITFDDFNINEGHFYSNPIGDSGSTRNVGTGSVADRITTDDPREGTGHQRITLNATTVGTEIRLRHLSGGGTIANNTPFTTTAGSDGWIGLFIKAPPGTDTNWTVSLWIEGSGANNFGTHKPIITDGQWHAYEWNLDDFSGDTNGWGWISTGILTGNQTVNDGSHTIDSVIFINTNGPASSTLYMDYVAWNPAGSITNLLGNPCLQTPGVVTAGPIATNIPQVRVLGAVANASTITVYQNSGLNGAFVPIGTKTSGIQEGENFVDVTGLVRNATVVATETVNGLESCLPPTGIMVGGGPNPSVRAALSIRETSGTGPIGDPNPDTTSSANIHFLGATTLSGGAPIDASVIYPSNAWQTVTFLRGTNVTMDSGPTTAQATVTAGAGYDANAYVLVKIFAYKQLADGRKVFSTAFSYMDATSPSAFQVTWSWDAVQGADGYRLIRNDSEHLDVPTANQFVDTNTGWQPGGEALPNSAPQGTSIKWNSATGDPNPIGTTNNIPAEWGILEAIAFVVNGDVGPFDIYIDSIQNGNVVFQNFESATNGQTGVGFQLPRTSGSTDGGLLSAPNIGEVSDAIAFDGTKSLHVSWEWNGTNASKWLRLTTSGAGNPMVNLNEPISFKLYMTPVGTPPPSSNPGPISVTKTGNNLILNWEGSYYLQESSNLATGFADVAGPISGPYTNAIGAGNKFYRLRK